MLSYLPRLRGKEPSNTENAAHQTAFRSLVITVVGPRHKLAAQPMGGLSKRSLVRRVDQ